MHKLKHPEAPPPRAPRVFVPNNFDPGDRISREPFRSWYRQFREAGAFWLEHPPLNPSEEPTDEMEGRDSERIRYLAWRSYFDDDGASARQLGKDLRERLESSPTIRNPFSKGLTRAAALLSAALSYDLCNRYWDTELRAAVNRLLFELGYSVSASMGKQSNNLLASNWMGVRYASIVLAAATYDGEDPTAAGSESKRSLMAPLLWEAQKRLYDHIRVNIEADAWNVESMGYHFYGWGYVGRAVRYLEARHPEVFSLSRRAPQALGALAGVLRTIVPVPTGDGSMGVKPDLSDDNMQAGTPEFIGDALIFDPVVFHRAYIWFFERLVAGPSQKGLREGLISGILWFPEKPRGESPTAVMRPSHHHSVSGVAVFRNRFQDENDVVVALNAKTTPRRGHSGPDTNAFRLLGLGSPWIVGAGRTGDPTGQSGLRPHDGELHKDGSALGRLEDVVFDGYNGGSCLSYGNCLGVRGHERQLSVDFSGRAGAAVSVVIRERSENGRWWRLAVPEFLSVEDREEGVALRSDLGATLLVRAIPAGASADVNRKGIAAGEHGDDAAGGHRDNAADKHGDAAASVRIRTVGSSPVDTRRVEIRYGRARYGGSTVARNPGIRYRGGHYEHLHLVDLDCGPRALLVMTLCGPEVPHPELELVDAEADILGATVLLRAGEHGSGATGEQDRIGGGSGGETGGFEAAGDAQPVIHAPHPRFTTA